LRLLFLDMIAGPGLTYSGRHERAVDSLRGSTNSSMRLWKTTTGTAEIACNALSDRFPTRLTDPDDARRCDVGAPVG